MAAAAISSRPFLLGAEGPRVSRQCAELRAVRVRALECRAKIAIGRGDHGAAVRDLEEVVAMEPFRETGYQRLMQAYASAGNPALALQVYERCRRVVAEELGVSPAADTEAVYVGLLRA